MLRDRVLVGASLLNLSFVIFGLSQLTAGFPAYATGPADVSTRVVGFAFLANTWAIASLQLGLRAMAGRRRTRAAALAGAAIAFAFAWLTVAGGNAFFLILAGACVATSALAIRFGRIVPREADTA